MMPISDLIIPLHTPDGEGDDSTAPPPAPPDVRAAGGKGASLLRLCRSPPDAADGGGPDKTSLSSSPPSSSAAAAIRVPSGFVLSAEYFRPWVDETARSGGWRRAVGILRRAAAKHNGDDDGRNAGVGGSGRRMLGTDQRKELDEACEAAKAFASKLPLPAVGEVEQAIGRIFSAVDGDADAAKATATATASTKLEVAVRSSSPEEDMAGASFAGLYETALHVDPLDREALGGAVRACFASCLDSRVWLYKLQRGMLDDDGGGSGGGDASDCSAAFRPSIAVVVQRMCPAATAGVAFSLNPLTNDYDEVLINSSWGVGEALVSGDVTPDAAVVVDAGDGDGSGGPATVVEYRLGDKGGDRPGERCLTDGQVLEIAAAIKHIERAYYGGDPVDVEWAVDGDGVLWILQARPVTTYVPLHPDLRTRPGERRDLYMDGYLTDGITMSKATTPMTNSIMALFMNACLRFVLCMEPGKMSEADPKEMASLQAYCGYPGYERVYANVSMYLHLIGKDSKTIRRQMEGADRVAADILCSPEMDLYRPAKPPKHLRKARLYRKAIPFLWKRRILYTSLIGPYFRPERFFSKYEAACREWDEWINRPLDQTQSVTDCLEECIFQIAKTAIKSTYPALMLFVLGMDSLKKLGNTDHKKELIDRILGGHEHDMIIQIGIQMHDIAQLVPPQLFLDLKALSDEICTSSEAESSEKGSHILPDTFFIKWNEFQHKFGCRGPLEMEVANTRYGEAPYLMLLQQMASVATTDEDYNPREAQRRQIAKREQAYTELMRILPFWKRSKLKRSYKTYTWWAECGTREMPKHHLVQMINRVRTLLLCRAKQFVSQGRLDTVNAVFELHLADVDRAYTDPELNLRAITRERAAYVNILRRHVHHFPLFIDSRGRILRPKRQGEEGELVGAPVSNGVVRGPVKVMNDPFEKNIEKGDILVAVTTDPGWTPLFIPAAAIVLQVGGELQHGALVAREYGKPCVTGIADVTTVLKDGQLVEVDGTSGIIRII